MNDEQERLFLQIGKEWDGEKKKKQKPSEMESKAEKEEGKIAGKMAEIAQNAPILSFFSKFSAGYAIRWLLWIFAVLSSLIGIVIVVIGTISAIFALSTISSPSVAILSDASLAIQSTALGVAAYANIEKNLTEASGSAAIALDKLGEGLNKTAQNLELLNKISGLPGMGGFNIGEASYSIREAAASIADSSKSIKAGAAGGQEIETKLLGVKESLLNISADLQNAKAGVLNAIFFAEISIAGIGIAVGLMLGGVLAIALAYGPPKKDG
jgi:uncharacterized membrane protein YphA (DoxX/SURF4 family)